MSYSKLGFISQLPFEEGDYIVAFLCASINKTRVLNQFSPDEGILPLTIPLIGKYDGYGGIMDYDEINGKLIEDMFGLKPDVLLKSMQYPNNFRTLDNALKAMSEYDKISHDSNKLKQALPITYEDTKNYTEACSRIYDTYSKCYVEGNEFSICYTMERLDVYEKIVQIMYNESTYESFLDMSKFLSVNKNDLSINILNIKEYGIPNNPSISMDTYNKLINHDEIDINEFIEYCKKEEKTKSLAKEFKEKYAECISNLYIRTSFGLVVYENYKKYDIHELCLDKQSYDFNCFLRFMDKNYFFFTDSYSGYQFTSDYDFKTKKEFYKYCLNKLEEYDNE